VEADALQAQQPAAAAKLGGAGCLVRFEYLREKRSGRGQLLQDRRQLPADRHLRQFPGFLAKVTEDVRAPIHVLRREFRRVALRGADFPQELVEEIPLGIFFGEQGARGGGRAEIRKAESRNPGEGDGAVTATTYLEALVNRSDQ